MDDQANVVGALRSDRKSLAPRRSGAVTGRCGRLMSYGSSVPEGYKQPAAYVARILKCIS